MEFIEKENKVKKFFTKLSQLPVGYSVLLVILTTLLVCLCAKVFFDVFSTAIPVENVPPMGGFLFLTILFIIVGIMVFLSWLLYAGACYLFLKLFGKTPNFERMLAVSALRNISLCVFFVVFLLWSKSIGVSQMEEMIQMAHTDVDFEDMAMLLPSLSGLILLGLFFFLIDVVAMLVFMTALLYYAFDIKWWQSLMIIGGLKAVSLFFFV